MDPTGGGSSPGLEWQPCLFKCNIRDILGVTVQENFLVGRKSTDDGSIGNYPGVIDVGKQLLYYTTMESKGNILVSSAFDILLQPTNTSWKLIWRPHVGSQSAPMNAVAGGRSRDGMSLYIARAHLVDNVVSSGFFRGVIDGYAWIAHPTNNTIMQVREFEILLLVQFNNRRKRRDNVNIHDYTSKLPYIHHLM